MPDPEALDEVLVDRYVRVVDELQSVIQQQPGAWQLDPLIECVLHDDLPDCATPEEAEEKRDAAIQALVARYRAEVEVPALESLRKLKASRRCRPAALCREPVSFSGAEDAAYYAEVLDGIELRLPDQLAVPPAVTSLELCISWPPDHHLRTRPAPAFIAGCDRFRLVFYVGTYRPGLPQPGFYLIYSSGSHSIAIVPPLSCARVNSWSHRNIAAGVAVLNLNTGYVLAELLLRKGDPSSWHKATLFMWWSAGTGPLAGRWIQKEVELPLPPAAAASFCADMIFPAGGTSLCWVDLLTGVLVCSHIDRLATTNVKDACPVFHFIPLPPKCSVNKAGTLRGKPEEYRSMCLIDNDFFLGDATFKFVSMVGYSEEDSPIDKVVLTTWTLKNTLNVDKWEWEEDAASFCIRDLWDDPIYKDDLKLQPLMPRFPVICTQSDGVIYLSVTDYEYMNGYGQEGLQLQPTGFYVLSLDMLAGRLSSAIKLPPDESGIVQHPSIFTSNFCCYLHKISEREMSRQMDYRGEEIAEEEESWLDYGKYSCTTSIVPMWSMPYTMGRCFTEWKFCPDGLGGRCVISSPSAVLRAWASSSFCPEGLMNNELAYVGNSWFDNKWKYIEDHFAAPSVPCTPSSVPMRRTAGWRNDERLFCPGDGLGVLPFPSAVLGASASAFCSAGLGLVLDEIDYFA